MLVYPSVCVTSPHFFSPPWNDALFEIARARYLEATIFGLLNSLYFRCLKGKEEFQRMLPVDRTPPHVPVPDTITVPIPVGWTWDGRYKPPPPTGPMRPRTREPLPDQLY
ncbi:hypothetical protein AVEN_241080-1 [Araneus ventricosus]|uniref:Uncharacterized protein n=1 Tax=Araneus ventricosus TaxID=182803 RepID=A0A4Y2LLB8_ARAVE|nr:hypothetical protein AVEN_241080-1 [Araneus ventricosus]